MTKPVRHLRLVPDLDACQWCRRPGCRGDREIVWHPLLPTRSRRPKAGPEQRMRLNHLHVDGVKSGFIEPTAVGPVLVLEVR